MADKNTSLSSDIYGVNQYVNEVKKEFITGVSEDTLMLGIFGYLGQIHSDMLQNAIVMASEFSNESIPTKAKFEKNIIAHALGLTISDINAVPAKMDVHLVFYEEDIINWAGARTANGDEKPWEFIFDKDNKIMFGDYEFHTDYDIIIRKVQVSTKGDDVKFAFTAQYKQDDYDIGNPVSDITNPYLTPPVSLKLEDSGTNKKFIFVQTTIRQVTKKSISEKVLSDDDISNKTITFTFEGQLAGFALDVTEGDETYHMIPVYEGLNVDTNGQLYFWYTYLDSNTIRIKFDKNSRIPKINADVVITYQTTEGSDGNFTYQKPEDGSYPMTIISSDKYSYANIYIQTRPLGDGAQFGADKKTIEELKQMIPKEALARGSITNTKDLENFFNATNTDYSKLYFYKKRDNCLERLYYSYMIMKNDNNVIPTNTLNMVLYPDQLDTEEGSNKYILRQGTKIILPARSAEDPDPEAHVQADGEVLPTDDDRNYDGSFTYYLPYDFIISKSPLYGMYFLTTIHANKILNFQYINDKCLYQYIGTDMGVDRNCLNDHNVYRVNVSFEQNISGNTTDSSVPIHYDEETGEYVCNVDVYMVIYDADKNPHRYAKATFDGFDPTTSIADFSFEFTTHDYIDIYNRIRIDTGLYDPGTETESYAHLPDNTMARLFVVSEQDDEYGFGDSKLPDIIPNLEGKSLSNTYDITGGFDWFYNYSNIVNSTVEVEKDPETEEVTFHVTGVPVIKNGYFDSEERAIQFFNELVSRKNYIDECVKKLEDAFEMDFKFFNTYGPARYYTWNGIDAADHSDCLDRVNINLVFNVRLKPNYDSNIEADIKADIKAYIEDINTIDSIHIPNLITEITNKYKDSIIYFEFVSINGMDPGYQHIYAMEVPDGIIVPDFINIDTYTDPDTGETGLPDITINFV